MDYLTTIRATSESSLVTLLRDAANKVEAYGLADASVEIRLADGSCIELYRDEEPIEFYRDDD